MDNKRKQERVQKKIRSQVQGKDMMTYSATQDISAGGLFITTPDPIEPGTELDLTLKLPSGEKIDVKGIVRWTKDEDKSGSRAGMGIEFISMKEADAEKIKKCL
ncbi:MAG: PilZ domain-containing protein [Spirochaetota bacterium]